MQIAFLPIFCGRSGTRFEISELKRNFMFEKIKTELFNVPVQFLSRIYSTHSILITCNSQNSSKIVYDIIIIFVIFRR